MNTLTIQEIDLILDSLYRVKSPLAKNVAETISKLEQIKLERVVKQQ